MPNWTDRTLEELRTLNKGQIVAAVARYLNDETKECVIELLMDTGIFYRHPVVTKRPDGQIERLEVESENALGDKVGSTVTTWQYFATGEIHYIATSICDVNNKEVQSWRIRHWRDERQPVMEDVALVAAVG